MATWLLWLHILLTFPRPLLTTETRCPLNSLCICRFDTNNDHEFGGDHDHVDATTVPSQERYSGQFGPITTRGYKDDFLGDNTSRASALDAGRVTDLVCSGIHFERVPDFSSGRGLSRVELSQAGLTVLHASLLSSSTQLVSLSFARNAILHLDPQAFRSPFASGLRSLDLGENELTSLPVAALARLPRLDWLNLHHNSISSLSPFSSSLHSLDASLSTLFLSRNDLSDVSDHLSHFRRLLWLNLDHNQIRSLSKSVLPMSLLTLSMEHNLIDKFPLRLIDNLPSLRWLSLRGNYIEALPQMGFTYRRRLQKLDLGLNFLSTLPQDVFNDTLSVSELNLDHNYIEHLSKSLFKTLRPRRLYLGHNRIDTIDAEAFENLGENLELLDLESNQLANITSAFNDLKLIRYLYLSKNKLQELPESIFARFCSKLKALSVAQNELRLFPVHALRHCVSLAHLNIGYNRIEVIKNDFFNGWARNLDTLIIRNNRIAYLESKLFRHASKLRELSLSFNEIETFEGDTLIDLAENLESLELSFGLRSSSLTLKSSFPSNLVKPLKNLLWLSLDNCDLKTIMESSLYHLGHLHYLNLEFNALSALPKDLLHPNVHKDIRDVRFSFNKFQQLPSGSFRSLPLLSSVMITYNRLEQIHSRTFDQLPSLNTLMLSNNKIRGVDNSAFVHLGKLRSLDLQFNFIRHFSLNVFDNCSLGEMLKVNLSHNQILELSPKNDDRVPSLHTLDVNHNYLEEVPRAMLEFVANSLHILDLSNNKIGQIGNLDFRQLRRLQQLKMNNNKILGLDKSAFSGLIELQILDISGNMIEVLQFGQFAKLSGLRSVNLAFNRLRSLPRDAFEGTKLEKIDLSNNAFVALPASALTETSSSLSHLDLSHNNIEHLDSTMFSNTPHLLTLSLAHNKLTILPDNVFIGLSKLLRLDLGGNLIRANFRELFHYVHHLHELRLREASIESLDDFILPNLISLDLGNNNLSHLPPLNLQRLRTLFLDKNNFEVMPASNWIWLPLLKTLSINSNPIRVLTKESFERLGQSLQELRARDLRDLKRFDADALSDMLRLRRLFTQSWPSIEKFKFRLGSIVSGLSSLQVFSAKILESSLTDQIHGALGPKLRTLELFGPDLRQVTLDAFEGIESHELLVVIRNTSIRQMPKNFISVFNVVSHLSLDLRDNQLEALATDVLYQNASLWTQSGTRILPGGLALQGNPWHCGCETSWLGLWLRRWLRETLQLHTSDPRTADRIQSVVYDIKCFGGYNKVSSMMIVDEDKWCESVDSAAISDAAITLVPHNSRFNSAFSIFIALTIVFAR